jgi:hypothetical protein
MEKFYNAVCWIGVGILVIFGVPLLLARHLVAPLWQFAWLFLHSPLPWWERMLAAAAVIAGFVYLISKSTRRRIPPNQKFVS